jgi:hypothetical protein
MGFAYVYRNLLSVHALISWVQEHGEVTIPRDNRRLVEHGSHEEHLVEVAKSLGGRWPMLARRLYGRNATERHEAKRSILDTNRCFLTAEESFIAENGISTRLGDATVAIECDPFPAAFGGTVEVLHLPFRQAIQALALGQDISNLRGNFVSPHPDGSLIRIGTLDYIYGRHGLMPIRLT